jgi:hypothetical protein
MTNRTIWLIEISKDKAMRENFEECVENGKTASSDLIDQLKRKGLQNVEKFISDDKIRFWRFVGDLTPNVSEDDILLFLHESKNKLYVTKASNTVEDEYSFSKNNYELLDCPNPRSGMLLLVTLVKPIKILNTNTKRVQNIIDRIHKNGLLVRGNYLWKYPYSGEIIQILLDVNLREFFNSEGYQLPNYPIAQFYTALKTKGFVILSGLSGTGKTKIALEFVKLLTEGITERLPEIMISKSIRSTLFKEKIRKIKETIEQEGFAVECGDYAEKIKKIKDLKLSTILWICNQSKRNQRVMVGILVTDIKKDTPYDRLPEDWKDGLKWIENVHDIDLIMESKFFIKIENVWEIDEPINNFEDLETGKPLSTVGKSIRIVIK